MNNNYLPLAYLNAWEYCPRRFYIEYELGEMADNEYILQGRHIHRNVDAEGTHQEENTITHRHQWVWSDRLVANLIIPTAGLKLNYNVRLIIMSFRSR